MKIPKRIAFYIRSNEINRDSIEHRLNLLQSSYDATDKIVVHKFIDKGFSGLTTDRPSLKKMLDLAAERAFDEVMVVDLSQLSRNSENLFRIIETLHAKGVTVSTANHSIDTSTFGGRFVFQIMAALIAFEAAVDAE